MAIAPALLPDFVNAIAASLRQHGDEITVLDQTIGDGDHLVNLQRGIEALMTQSADLASLAWPDAWQKIGMTLMSQIGGASGSLLGTLFIAMAKAGKDQPEGLAGFAECFHQGVEAMKRRGKSDVGEKTMLDVLVPVDAALRNPATAAMPLGELLAATNDAAAKGLESTRDLVATKGRASFLGERAKGWLDPGAQTSQLMISAITGVIAARSAAPA